MKIEEIRLKWLEISLKELGREDEYKNLEPDDLVNIANMGIDELRRNYLSEKSCHKGDIESILYAFANKFLTGKDLEQVKEELRVTEIGKSLIEEGERKKAMEIAKSLLDVLSIEMIASKTGLTIYEVKSLKDEGK